ncbi:IclR family transcriptional regulator [Halobacteria archaeon AArc-m2/3/4]|uniref:IclR family transcriptional regulator n=1 Tax=Natronoglomus mannanivorans TaxID=2979990 RepID=A0AAP3E3Q7_9EURY|nr:IclR family transcriptional regulator [Halobacteria archaeon AArc-xg1-1]MCU4974072.1 IclR family transcriptional regulator [Halobacteria archaeon AArc-m2/3/4]
MAPKEAKNPVRSIERAARILELLKELDGARLVDLEEHVELSKGTIHSYLATLEQCGLVSRDGMTYEIGLDALTLGGYARDREQLYVLGREGADELAEKTGELVALMTEWNGRSTYLYQRAGERAMAMDSHLGVQLPIHCTASGKAILSELPEDRVHDIVDAQGLPVWTDNTITDRAALFEELESIRDRGISFDDEERIDGLRGIGVPIKRDDTLLGAIALAGPVNRLEGDRYWQELPDQLTKIKRMIEVKAKYPQS